LRQQVTTEYIARQEQAMPPEVSQKIEQFFSKYKIRQLDKDQLLILADQEPEGIYSIVSGQIRQYLIDRHGNEIVANIYKPPSFFPIQSAINKNPNKYFFKAAVKTKLRCAPANETVKFLKANPDVVFDLLSRVYRGLDGLLGRLMQSMSGSARSRLLYELLIYSLRFGRRKPDGSYHLDISEHEIATLVGTARETINRELHNLKQEDLVTIHRNELIIKDIDKIKTALESES
jgi:CRP/FNR family transcriptional regulator, cyclic AMP receptor protein